MTEERYMVSFFKYLKEWNREEGQDLFSFIPECRTWNNGFKLQESRFQVNFINSFLIVKNSWTKEPITEEGYLISGIINWMGYVLAKAT